MQSNRISAWNGCIIVLLFSQRQSLSIIRREEQSSMHIVTEMLHHAPVELQCCFQISGIKDRLIEVDQSPDKKCIIVQIAFNACFSKVAVQQPAIICQHLPQDEVRSLCCSLCISIVLESLGSFCQGSNHQAIPVCENFVISVWAHPPLS